MRCTVAELLQKILSTKNSISSKKLNVEITKNIKMIFQFWNENSSFYYIFSQMFQEYPYLSLNDGDSMEWNCGLFLAFWNDGTIFQARKQ